MEKKPTARLKEGITYTPHGLGIAYTNANLTDKAALDILKAHPDAAQFFDSLPEGYTPPALADDEDEHDDEDDDKKPVRLSRMNKEALEKTYLAEVADTLPADYTNDDLRKAIADKRAATPTE